MAEEKKPEAAGEGTPPMQQGGEDIKNLKAEMGRKFDNIAAQLQAFVEQAKPKAPAPEAAPKKPSVFEDEEAYAARIIEEADKRAEQKLARMQEAQARQQQTISSLVAEFPELAHGDHDLTKKAVETFNGMSAEEKAFGGSMKLAVQQAALELGIKPKSKRSDDDFYGLPGGAPSQTRTKKKDNELDWRTEEFARLVGVNVDDPKVKERLINKHGRKDYTNWG